MRKIIYILIVFTINTSCSKTIFINLNDREFTDKNPYKVEKLNFINDSICIYSQEFLCDIDNAYKITKTTCLYSVKDKYIVLKNITKNSHSDSNSISCISLPYSVIQQCKYMRDDLLDIHSRPLLIGAPPPTSLAELYGYINILQTDTLYYDKNIIYYTKSFKDISYYMPIMIQTSFFVESENERDIKRLYKRAKRLGKKIPFNRAECHGAVPLWE